MSYRMNIPSLEQIALIKTAVDLWNQDDIKFLLCKFYKSLETETSIVRDMMKWEHIKSRVVRKVMHLSQPTLFKEKIMTFIEPVSSQIVSWMYYHRFLSNRLGLPKEFCWTPYGTIDVKKTAEVFVKDCNLDVSSRFKLACVYCLEDDISELWKKMLEYYKLERVNRSERNDVPELAKKHVENFEMNYQDGSLQNELVTFWISVMKDEVHKMYASSSTDPHQLTINQHAFEIAVKFSSRAAVQHFLRKMTPSQREESLFRFARNVPEYLIPRHTTPYREIKTDVLVFLLFQLDERGKSEVFKNYAFDILIYFLRWPRQCLFMEAVSYGLKFLPVCYFFKLLDSIVGKIDSKDYNYREIFVEFWKQGVDFYKISAIEHYGLREYKPLLYLLRLLFIRMEEVEITSLILKSMTESQKERVIFSGKGKEICERLYSAKNWDLLKFFISECIPSKNISFKEELIACLNVKENCDKFSLLIAELASKDEDSD